MKTKRVCILSALSIFLTGCKAKSFESCISNLELMGNPTTGYSWSYTLEDDSIINISEDIQYLGGEGVVGASSRYKYSLKSLKPGSTTLKFEYKRPWEEKEAEQVRNYEITVKSDGKIKMTEKNTFSEKPDFKSVSMAEGLAMMKGEADFVLLDVRRLDEYAAGHIPGAVLLTNETMTEESASGIIKNKDQKIYCYCRSGRRSKIACKKLADWGYKNIIEIGGILDYSGTLEK